MYNIALIVGAAGIFCLLVFLLFWRNEKIAQIATGMVFMGCEVLSVIDRINGKIPLATLWMYLAIVYGACCCFFTLNLKETDSTKLTKTTPTIS